MKKLVFGCLFVVILLAIVGGILGYVFVVEPAREYLVTFRQLGELSEYDRGVTNKAAFEPPASGELTEEMVRRFAEVQEAVLSRLGDQITQLNERYTQLVGSYDTAKPDARAVVNALHDLSGVLTQAKRLQVDALNRVGFSVAEYRWVRDRVYEAAGVAMTPLDFKAIWDAARRGTFELEPTVQATPGEVPARNKDLVKPYLEKIQRWATLGWAGL